MESKIKIKRRQLRVRSKMAREGFRLSLSRSNKFVFAQIIDQKTGKTILGIGDKLGLEKEEVKGKTKTEKAKLLGNKLAEQALKNKIKEVIFDRGAYRYHGRIRAFAEGAREGGLKF